MSSDGRIALRIETNFVIVASLVYFLFGFAVMAIFSALPAIAIDLEMSHSMTGLVIALPKVFFQIAALVVVILSKKGNPFKIMLLGLFCVPFSIILITLSKEYFQFLLGKTLFFFGFGVTEMSIVFGVSVMAFRRTGGVLNVVHAFFALGCIISPGVVSIFLTDASSWNIPLCIPLAISLIIIPFALKIAFKQERTDNDMESERIAFPKELLFWLIIIGCFIYVGYESGLSSWLSTFVYEAKAFPLRGSSLLPSLLWIGLFLGRLATGIVVDRFGLEKTLVSLTLASLIGVSMIIFSNSTPLLITGVFMTGLGYSGIFPTLQALLVSSYRQNRAAILCAFTVAGSMGALATNLLVGSISETVSLFAGMSFILTLIVLSLILFTLLGISHAKTLRNSAKKITR
jgi:MFS family permease